MSEYHRLTTAEEGGYVEDVRGKYGVPRIWVALAFVAGLVVSSIGQAGSLAAYGGSKAMSGKEDDSAVAARHRTSMLERGVAANIIECSADAKDDSCRMSPTNRYKVLGQKGVTLWMTGLSGSGKTTISKALERRLLLQLGKNVYNIDGDNLRTGLTRDLGFSPSDRGESVRRASEVAQLFSEAGVITMVTLISPYRKDRDAAREAHRKRAIPFLEVFMDVCRQAMPTCVPCRSACLMHSPFSSQGLPP